MLIGKRVIASDVHPIVLVNVSIIDLKHALSKYEFVHVENSNVIYKMECKHYVRIGWCMVVNANTISLGGNYSF